MVDTLCNRNPRLVHMVPLAPVEANLFFFPPPVDAGIVDNLIVCWEGHGSAPCADKQQHSNEFSQPQSVYFGLHHYFSSLLRTEFVCSHEWSFCSFRIQQSVRFFSVNSQRTGNVTPIVKSCPFVEYSSTLYFSWTSSFGSRDWSAQIKENTLYKRIPSSWSDAYILSENSLAMEANFHARRTVYVCGN